MSLDNQRLINEVAEIEAANLGFEGRMVANVMMFVRNYVIERQARGPVKPIESWDINDIVEIVRSMR